MERVLVEIDGRSASYDNSQQTRFWMHFNDQHTSIMAQATIDPLEFKSTSLRGISFNGLAHPSVAHVDARLELFADIGRSAEIKLMTGSEDSLSKRAARVPGMSQTQLTIGTTSGTLMIYCGGCRFAVSHCMNDVASCVKLALDNTPLVGIFTFSEQGENDTADSEHGTVMTSCISFGVNEAPDRSYT